MSFRFDISVTRVECLHEQLNEWGKDEMHLFGFGVSRKGTLFATGYRNLGSYHEGDVKSGAQFAPPLFGAELPNDGLEVLFYFWLVEEDGRGVGNSAASLEAEFRESYRVQATQLSDVEFPRECIPFTAFYKAILPLQPKIEDASTDGRNDELYAPVDLLLRYPTDAITPLQATKDVTIRRSKHLGDYLVTFRYGYGSEPLVIG